MFQQEVEGVALVVITCTIPVAHGSFMVLIQVVPPSAVQADANCKTAFPLFGLVGVLAIGSYFEYPKIVAKTPVLVSANEYGPVTDPFSVPQVALLSVVKNGTFPEPVVQDVEKSWAAFLVGHIAVLSNVPVTVHPAAVATVVSVPAVEG